MFYLLVTTAKVNKKNDFNQLTITAITETAMGSQEATNLSQVTPRSTQSLQIGSRLGRTLIS